MRIDDTLVRRLLAAQFPQWAGLPLEEFPSGGTVNAVFRLGDGLCVRLPRAAHGAGDVERERCWLPRLAPLLPTVIPEVVAGGTPGEGFPWPWAVQRWLDGDPPVEGRLERPGELAAELGGFVAALRQVSLPGGPPAYRGTPLATVDHETRNALARMRALLDSGVEDFRGGADALTAAWEAALAAPPWDGPPVWLHSDLMPTNLLVRDGRLAAVLDFATAGVGDPACDLIPAWNLLTGESRDVFRRAAGADEAAWARGRGWALSMALIQLPHYRVTNPVVAANARHVIEQVLADS
jgi:aminoglycoside phosphotransferase (APT) family kinase protein